MNDLVLLGALAAGWYLFLRDTAPTAAKPEPVPLATPEIGEQQFPIFDKRAAGAPLPPSAQAPTTEGAGTFFGAVVVAPRPPPSLSNRTSRVSNT